MSYIRFYNLLTESIYDGFLIDEDEDYFYLLDPILAEWIYRKGHYHWIEAIEPKRFEKEFFSYSETVRPFGSPPFIGSFTWLYEYEVSQGDIPHTPAIANFFEWLSIEEPMTMTDRLALATERTKPILPPHLQQELRLYALENRKKHPVKMRRFADGI